LNINIGLTSQKYKPISRKGKKNSVKNCKTFPN
jgi:hypothetical protein